MMKAAEISDSSAQRRRRWSCVVAGVVAGCVLRRRRWSSVVAGAVAGFHSALLSLSIRMNSFM